MKIQEIHVKNFGVFQGESSVSLHDRPGKNICHVDGKNGFGKTTLQKAIKFALYGFSEDPRDLFDKINRYARKQGDHTMSVRLQFTHDGKNFVLTRSVEPASKGQVQSYRDLEEQVTLLADGRVVKNYDDRLNEILPRDASEFFFFDGEDIQKYAEQENPQDTKNAIELVLEIPAIRNARDDLEVIDRDIGKELGVELERAGKMTELKEKMERLGSEIQISTQQLQEFNSSRDELTKDIEGVEEELSKREIAQELLRKIEMNKTSLASLQRTKSEAEKKYLETVSILPYVMLKPTYDKYASKGLEEVKTARSSMLQRSKLDGTIDALAELNERGECFCGTKIGPGEKTFIDHRLKQFREKLDEFKEIMVDPDREARLLKTSSFLENLNVDLKPVDAQIRGLQDEIDDVESQNQSLEEKLREVPVAEIQNLQKRRSSLNDQVVQRREQIAQTKAIIELKEEERDEAEKTARKLMATEAQTPQFAILDKQLQLVRSTSEALKVVIQRTIEQKKRRIEEEANKVFRQLTNKPEAYDHLKIADDYSLYIINNKGEVEDRTKISAGERQIVALSFIAGLARATRQEAPVVMDTPFGHLDKDHKTNVIHFLPNLASQVIILATDEDIDESYMQVIDPSICDRYRLIFDSQTLSSRLVAA
jgi:DNA sulfur modification protein DndD